MFSCNSGFAIIHLIVEDRSLIRLLNKENGMKKTVLTVAMILVFGAVSFAISVDDQDFSNALKHYNSRNFNAAASTLTEYVNRTPVPKAYYLLGYSLYELGRFSEADECFRQAFLIDPEFSLEKVGLIQMNSGEIIHKEPVTKKHGAAKKTKRHVRKDPAKAPSAAVKTPAPKQPDVQKPATPQK